jgi:AP2 domain/HNH endonuclease
MNKNVVVEPRPSGCSSSGQSIGLRSRESRASARGARIACRVAPDRLPWSHPDDPSAMLVRLSGGLIAVIDASDSDAISAHTWSSAKAGLSDTLFYAVTKIGGRVVKLHRFLWSEWGNPPVPRLDHKDGDPLNCRRSNIRRCTQSQNLANAKIPSSNTSGFKGVSKTPSGRWAAKIAFSVKGERKSSRLGTFDTPEDAGAAYMAAAKKRHGEFARAS